ncbi:MAG: metallophosphoesterase family protein [Candidatus Bilamarchaeaceae archaeon]
MKILVFSDLHEEEQALQKIKNYAEKIKPDLVLSCGDTARSVDFAERTLNSFSNLYFVPGNWDSKASNDFYVLQKNFIHKKRVEVEKFNIVGFGFSPITPFHTYGEKKEKEIKEEMEELPIDNNTILVLHAPPQGFFDKTNSGEKIGSAAVLEIVRKRKPFACIFGHVHETIGFVKKDGINYVKIPPAKDNKCAVLHFKEKYFSVEFVYL